MLLRSLARVMRVQRARCAKEKTCKLKINDTTGFSQERMEAPTKIQLRPDSLL